ncbi:MAG TPA: VWA domain-containing protein [Pyrinomonadaceae bacterium]|nr:VWA domain-containing protein [Pyrinomonadaceae bacterium]
MRFFLAAVFVCICGSVTTQAQSCLTPDDIKQMLARMEATPAATPEPSPPAKVTPSPTLNKKLQSELIKIATKQQDLLHEVVAKDQTKRSDQEKLHQLYEASTVKLCELLKTNGWPTTAMVDREGVAATYYILKNGGTYEMQRDLLPVILAAIKKDPLQKPEFAGLFDRLRVSAGMKQIFGTQAVSMGGFLVLYPIEDEKHVDDRRAEFGMSTMEDNVRSLERTYGRPLIKSRQPPERKVSKELANSLSDALASAAIDGTYVDPGDVIKTETDLVNLNVSVFNDKSKTFVGSLNKEDFKVLENGKEQTVTYFASTDVPFDLVLLIDLSGSTSDKRDLIKTSTLRFIEAARPNDRLAIVTFSNTVTVVSPLTLDRAQLAASVAQMEGAGGSHVWDAVKFALDKVLGPKTLERRRAVVLMSDGVDGSFFLSGSGQGSQTSFADLVEQVRQTDTLIVPIYLDTEETMGNPFTRQEYENARHALNLLAQESGGSYYKARKLSDLNGVYEQVINDLGKVYSLGYQPTTPARDGSWRWVQVSIVNRPDLVARARPGYYAQ